MVNGLAAFGLNPWHIKASYETYDDTGQAEPTGTFEEFWLSPTHFKRTFTSPEYNETEFGTSRGLYRVGDQDWPGKVEFLLHNSLIDPVPQILDRVGLRLEKRRVTLGNLKLQCLTLQSPNVFTPVGLYCFEPDQPTIRLAVSWNGHTRTTYNNIILFQGRYIARDVSTINYGRLVFAVHVELIESLSQGHEPDLSPPTTAIPIAEPIALSAGDAIKLSIVQRLPNYQHVPDMYRIQGTLVLDVVVDKDGDVKTIQYASGPREPLNPAVLAVRSWKYQPFLFPGDPLAFHTQVHIIFKWKR